MSYILSVNRAELNELKAGLTALEKERGKVSATTIRLRDQMDSAEEEPDEDLFNSGTSNSNFDDDDDDYDYER